MTSALNKIIYNSHFKRWISLQEQETQKEDRFLRGRQIAYLIYEQFRVTGTDVSVENYTDLFSIVVRNDDIQEFDSKWDGILLSMTKIQYDDILEGLYKVRIRESDKLKTALELYDLEIHQKKLGPDYHRLKAMVRLITKIGKALPSLGGTGKIPGGILHLSITATMDPSVRPTASTTSETTTRATCTSPERARRAHSSTLDVISHLIWLKF